MFDDLDFLFEPEPKKEPPKVRRKQYFYIRIRTQWSMTRYVEEVIDGDYIQTNRRPNALKFYTIEEVKNALNEILTKNYPYGFYLDIMTINDEGEHYQIEPY